MRRLLSVVLTLVVAGAILAVVLVSLAYAGVVPVAAHARHMGPVEWYLHTAADRAVDRGAEGVTPPPDATSPEMLRIGAHEYQEMCATCHGAPGVEPSSIGKGLYPRPPRLERHKRARIEPTYWIVKNGIRDTGMPAFVDSHSDRVLWAIAAFTVAMPHLSPEEYARQTAEAEDEERHEHADEGAHSHSGAEASPPAPTPSLPPPHGPG